MLKGFSVLVPVKLHRFLRRKTPGKSGGAAIRPCRRKLVSEFAQLLGLFRRENVRRYLEIGTRYGGSFNAVMRSLPPGAFGVAVDLPGVAWGRSSSEIILRRVADLRKDGYNVELLIGSSREPAIIEAVAKHAPFDAVFIDGDHRPRSASRLVKLRPACKDRRVPRHHRRWRDRNRSNTNSHRGPVALARSFCASGNVAVHEFIADPKHSPLPRSLGPCGIGVAITLTRPPS